MQFDLIFLLLYVSFQALYWYNVTDLTDCADLLNIKKLKSLYCNLSTIETFQNKHLFMRRYYTHHAVFTKPTLS